MVDLAYYVNFFTEPEKLLFVIPVFVIVVVLIILLASYFTSPSKKGPEKKGKETIQPEKINFREDFDNILRIENPEAAIRDLSLLINKFFSQLFQIRRSFAYDEIRKEAEAYGFREIAELCNTLQNLNFGKNVHSADDFKGLSQAFKNALDSYEYIIIEGWKKKKKESPLSLRLSAGVKSLLDHLNKVPLPRLNLPPSKITFTKVWIKLTPAIKEMQLKQLEKKLLLNYRHLFSTEIEDQTNTPRSKDGQGEISRLLRLGKTEIEKANTVSASAAYNRLVSLFNSLTPEEREPFANQTLELYINIINLAALKACGELIQEINTAVSSRNYSEARQLFYQLRYIYDRLPPRPSRIVYDEWQQTIQQTEQSLKSTTPLSLQTKR